MRTGRFVWRPTGPWRPVMYTNPDGPPKLDYVGLNYYSRCCGVLGTLRSLSVNYPAVAACHFMTTHPPTHRGRCVCRSSLPLHVQGNELRCPEKDAWMPYDGGLQHVLIARVAPQDGDRLALPAGRLPGRGADRHGLLHLPPGILHGAPAETFAHSVTRM